MTHRSDGTFSPEERETPPNQFVTSNQPNDPEIRVDPGIVASGSDDSEPRQLSLRAAALSYAAKGLHVYPVWPRSKDPLTKHGFHDASTDLYRIGEWWDEWPNANIGCVPGRSGFVVIDIDGPQAELIAADLGLRTEPTAEVITGREGGRHLWYRHPGGTIRNLKLASGIDVRADNGGVILPPSIHPDGPEYRWLRTLDAVADLPGHIVARLSGDGARSGNAKDSAREFPWSEVEEGERNTTLTSLAGRYIALGCPVQVVLELLLAFNEARCNPPLSADEVQTIVESVARMENRKRDRGLAVTRRLSEVKRERVRWLAPGRIPFGKITILEGDPGLGKSTVALDIAARVSRGEGLPGDPGFNPADVVLLTAEDGLADTVKPRLEAANADCSRIHTCEGFWKIDGTTEDIELPGSESLRALEELIRRTGAWLVVIDVLMAYLGKSVDSFKDHDIRRALRPLKEIAERTGAAFVLIRHLKKGVVTKAIDAGGGSVGLGGAARSVLVVAKDPDDGERRVLASVKSNLAKQPRSLVYRIESTDSESSRIVWLGESDQTADSLTEARANGESGSELSKIEECGVCIRDWLLPAPMDRQEILRLGDASGFSEATIERAAKRIGVIRQVSGYGKDKRSLWSLPSIPSAEPISVNAPEMQEPTELKGPGENGTTSTEDEALGQKAGGEEPISVGYPPPQEPKEMEGPDGIGPETASDGVPFDPDFCQPTGTTSPTASDTGVQTEGAPAAEHGEDGL